MNTNAILVLTIALYTLLACAVCVLLALWSLKVFICLIALFALLSIIFWGLNGREYEGYL